MDRREFMIGSGAAVSARVAATAFSVQPAAGAPPSWQDVRALFGLAPDRVQMSGFFLASHPRPVAEAIERHRRGLDADPFTYIEENVQAFETRVRDAASRYMGVDGMTELAFTDSTSMGLGLVYHGLPLRRGQEVVTDTHDHIVTHIATQGAADLAGATVRRVPLYDEPSTATADLIVQRVAQALRPQTRLLALTWVHSGTGVKLPVQRISEVVRTHNRGRSANDRVIFALDGVHGFGLEDVRIPDLGCDIFVAGCHKWLFGPRGTGLVWARPDVWRAARPTIPTFDPMWRPGAVETIPAVAWHTPGGFHSFEHRWALADAFEFMSGLGKPRVAARIHELNRRCKEQMAKLPRVKVRTPMADDLSGGIICFEVQGLTPDEVMHRLHAQRIVASTTPGFYRPQLARVAPSLLTLEADVDRTVAAIAAL